MAGARPWLGLDAEGDAAAGVDADDLSGLCLDVTGTATANGSKAQLWSCTGASNQKWSLSSGG